ncbi:PREDICTED: uncharacterized protein LOC109589757 [Amphimedon queenslandica]|uniref:Death domain-containing protein n=1 Tax=Amphimedon queenslandica TaxID=400682 RepID=A0AAN0JW90_AMPQE|nr:PREDICTED: uncharacterized protein LOC109589757 [Amphimedon queenslandica]|eukprot:XP_019861339.1 PREDICTED: uncharacterized protein LOC109589757 [Amphimedon queenslandica]
MCSGWVIVPLCIAAVAVVLMIYLPSYLQMKGKEGEPTNHVHVHPEDVKPPQVPLPTTASKPLDISDLAEIVSKLKECKFDPSRWKDLCLDIGLNEVTIRTIRSDEDTVNDRLRSCLVKWLNRVEDVDKKGGATWESLENGLINIGQKLVAEKLRERRKNRNK